MRKAVYILHKQKTVRRAYNARLKTRPPPLITFSSSHKHGRTTHNNFGSVSATQLPPQTSEAKTDPFKDHSND